MLFFVGNEWNQGVPLMYGYLARVDDKFSVGCVCFLVTSPLEISAHCVLSEQNIDIWHYKCVRWLLVVHLSDRCFLHGFEKAAD